MANKVVLDLRSAMFSRLVRLPARYFNDNTPGALLSKVAYDVSGVAGAATTVLTVLVRIRLPSSGCWRGCSISTGSSH